VALARDSPRALGLDGDAFELQPRVMAPHMLGDRDAIALSDLLQSFQEFRLSR